jgi:hypothetical protein
MDGTGLDVHYVAIDSRARDVVRFPNVSEYVVDLNYTLRDVESIEIMALQMSRGESNVHSGNRTLYVSVGGASPQVIALPIKQYTQAAFLDELQTALRAVHAGFTVTTDSDNRVRIANPSAPFTVGLTGSMDRLLGFPKTSHLSSDGAGNVVQAPHPLDVTGEPYALLYINDWDRYIGNDKAIDTAFFIIPFEERGWRTRFHICNSELEKKGIYLLNNSHRNLSSLRVRFTRPDGTLYDFGGIDHQIVLRINARNKRSN